MTCITNSKVAASLALLVLLTAQMIFSAGFTSANFTPLPQLPTPITIKPDGTVDPATAPIQQVGNTYTLTGNINNTIEIQRSNVVLNGDGRTLTKPSVDTEDLMTPIGWLPSVHILAQSNVVVTNIALKDCYSGITVENSSDITISQNTIRNCQSGIVVKSSFNVNIVRNDIALPDKTFASGITLISSNPDSPNPSNLKIENNCIIGLSTQVPTLSYPEPLQYGINGIFSDSQVVDNSITQIKGIGLYEMGSNNLIVGNNFQDNYKGILVNSEKTLFVNNTFYGNNFNHNTENVIIPYIHNPPVNCWDNGTLGNYWSDYDGADLNLDGIGDTPYLITTTYQDYELNQDVTVLEGQDNYPSMAPLAIAGATGAIGITSFNAPTSTATPSPTLEASPSPSASPTASASTSAPTTLQASEPNTPSPTLLIAAAAIAIIVCLGAVAIYINRRRPKSDMAAVYS